MSRTDQDDQERINREGLMEGERSIKQETAERMLIKRSSVEKTDEVEEEKKESRSRGVSR